MSLLGATATESAILETLSLGDTDLTGLAHLTNIDSKELLSALTMLEINGRAQQDSTGNWHLL